VQIVYNDGSVWNEDRQIDMYSGERSRPINPTSESRFVDQINITQVPSYGRGRLQITGYQDDDGRRIGCSGRGPSYTAGSFDRDRADRDRADRDRDRDRADGDRADNDLKVRPTVPEPTQTRPGQSTPGGDVLFGAQYVGFLTDHDVIRVGNEVGKFAKIRLR